MSEVGSGWKRRLELAANIVIIFSGLVLGVRLVKPELLGGLQGIRPSISAGSKFALAGLGEHQRTLVLVLREGCPYCTESAPFYQKLVHEAEESKRVHLMAVLPQEPSNAREYLKQLGVAIADIRQATLASLRIEGTPTLVLVNNAGVVTDVWIGKLSSRNEAAVLKKTWE
jgi:hypothetical protein